MMKLRLIKVAALLLLVGALVVGVSSVALAGPPWSDASASWWESSYGVTEAQVATVADGFPDGTFRPGTAVTRGQFAKMAVNGLGVDTAEPAKATFKDVIPSHRFYMYIEGAYAKGLIGGYPSGGGLLFKPDSNITRQQANSILGRYLSKLEITITGSVHGVVRDDYGSLDGWYKAEGPFYLDPFDDEAKVTSDHRANTAYLIYRKIVKGSNDKLNPGSTLTRSQAAALILRVKAEAEAIMTPPVAPTNLRVTATGPDKTVVYNSALQKYMGNDPTPQVTGDTLASSEIAIYDIVGGVTSKALFVDTSNSAGKFHAYLDPLLHSDWLEDELGNPYAIIDGTHGFVARVRNANGLVSPQSEPVTYLLDTVAPTGAVTKPTVPIGGTTAVVTNPKPEFTAVATDSGSGVSQVTFQYYKTGAADWETVSADTQPETGNTYAAAWPSSGGLTAEGEYLFRVVVVDNVGNQYTSASVSVIFDTGGPAVVITSPLPTSGTVYYSQSRTPLFTAHATDSVGTGSADITSVEFFYAAWVSTGKPTTWEAFTPISTDTTPDWSAVIAGEGIPEGHWIFAVRATDSAGNKSALMNGTVYATGVTQEVVIDASAPLVSIISPLGGQMFSEGQPLTIVWNVEDVTPPDTVKIEYTLDASASFPDWMLLEAATPNDGLHVWNTPDILGDKTHCQIRITAVDKFGRSFVAYSGHFTLWDTPNPVTNLVANDLDDTAGVDGSDFQAGWTISSSPDIISQKIYILPASVAAVDMQSHSMVETLLPTATFWKGPVGPLNDSLNQPVSAGSYRIWVLVTDVNARTQAVASNSFTVKAP